MDSSAEGAEAEALATTLGSSRPEPVIVKDGEEEDGPDPMLGRVLSGLYKVDTKIGEGGMGTVYNAVHVHLQKRFAVKVLSTRVATNSEAIDRLKQEAIAASGIDHDNIVDVVNFDVTKEGDVFIVMELLNGEPLSDIVEEGRMSLDRAIPLVLQICGALEAAHSRGIVHRDLKPENVFITQKGNREFAKVLDFGISKVKTAEAEQVRMTKTGQLVGTPLYMSPEQARGEPDVDRRCDIYSLGVMVYEMLTGEPPFTGGNYFQLLWKHGNEEPPRPSERYPGLDLPEGVEAALLKALAKERDDRFGNMSEFGAALQAAVPDLLPVSAFNSLTPTPTPMSTRRDISQEVPITDVGRDSEPVAPPASSKTPLLVGLALLAVAAIATIYFLTREPPSDGPAITSGETTTMEVGMDTSPSTMVEEPVAMAEPNIPVGAEPTAPVIGVIEFKTTPPGASVAFDGQDLGVTPITARLPIGPDPVQVRFRKAGYRVMTVTVNPEDGLVVSRRLQRRGGVAMSPDNTMMGGGTLGTMGMF